SEPHVLVLQSARPLPSSTAVTFVWDAGIRSPGGIATASPQRFEFEVRSPFLASLHCERTHEAAPCNPMGSISLHFSAPVEEGWAGKVELRGPDGKKTVGKASPYGGYLQSLRFEGPFRPLSRYEVVLPAGLRDDFGREVHNRDAF